VPVAFAAVKSELVFFLCVELHALQVGKYEPVDAKVVGETTAGAVHDENDCIHEV
jgi:hypothetical protein